MLGVVKFLRTSLHSKINKGLEMAHWRFAVVLGLRTVDMRETISLLARRHWDEGGPDVEV